MVIKINWKKIFAFFCVGVFAISFLCILINSKKAETIAAFPIKGKIIVVDAGHGGIDGGTSGYGGLEKNINLAISKYLKSYLEQSGAKVIMTRESDISLGERENTIREKKRTDIKERKSIVDNISPDIFVSIHQNFFSESKYKGAQTFYESNNINSFKLAGIVQEALRNNLDKKNNRNIAEVSNSKALFRDLKVPAILIECGFLSNKEEAELLKSKEYQQKLAHAIYIGISQYFCQ